MVSRLLIGPVPLLLYLPFSGAVGLCLPGEVVAWLESHRPHLVLDLLCLGESSKSRVRPIGATKALCTLG